MSKACRNTEPLESQDDEDPVMSGVQDSSYLLLLGGTLVTRESQTASVSLVEGIFVSPPVLQQCCQRKFRR